MKELSIIVPCYNEEKRVRAFARDLIKHLKSDWEIIFVDDGSIDKTYDVIRDSTGKKRNVRIIKHRRNHGKGTAVKTGVLKSTSEYVVFMDADGSTPAKEINKMVGELREYDVVLGSRVMPDSDIKTPQPFYRTLFSRLFNFYVNALFRLGVSDTLCGFKGFSRKSAEQIFRRIRTSGWIFDIEMLAHAKKMGFPIKQIGIEWSHKSGSKLSVFRSVPKMFVNVLKLYIVMRNQDKYKDVKNI